MQVEGDSRARHEFMRKETKDTQGYPSQGSGIANLRDALMQSSTWFESGTPNAI